MAVALLSGGKYSVIREYEKGFVAEFTIPCKIRIKENNVNELKNPDIPISKPASATVKASDIFLLY